MNRNGHDDEGQGPGAAMTWRVHGWTNAARVQGWTSVAGATDGESDESTDGQVPRAQDAQERPEAKDGSGILLTRPVLWSAAAHLLFLSACLLVGAGRGPADRRLPVVEVVLVGGESIPAGAELARPGSAAPPRRLVGLPPRPRGEGAPSLPAGGRLPGAAATPSGPATIEVRTADPAARPAELPASAPAAGISAGPAAPGSPVEAAPVFPGSATGGAPSGPAAVSEGEGAGPGGTGDEADRSRPGGAIGLLRERIQSRLVYPSEAVRRGLEGVVLLRIRIETGGIPREILVARSSGARVLDVAARRGVVDASPLPTDPGWIEVPVLFRLR